MNKTLTLAATTLASSLLLAPCALAWTPALDAAAVDQVIDSAVGRSGPLSTVATLDLGIKAGEFGTPGAVTMFRGPETCLSTWKTAPTNYAQNGSRPLSLLVGGQADIVFLEAQNAWNNFETPEVGTLLATARKVLPDGHLRVYMTMQGLANVKSRDAYTIAARLPDGTLLRPYRTSFLTDWKDAEGRPASADAAQGTKIVSNSTVTTNADGSTTINSTTTITDATQQTAQPSTYKAPFSGSMVYYFDFSKKTPGPKLDLVVRTEAKNDCVYLLSSDLNSFK